MTDRQPGAPGQYTLTVDAAEAPKLLTGEAVTVTLVRDDQPLVEGTPYNKASVLPDDLAAQICPAVTDPTPADAFEGLTIKTHKHTLYSNAWTTDSLLGFVQTITIDGLTDNNKTLVYPSWPYYMADKLAVEEEARKVRACSHSGNKLTFECWEEKPSKNITVIVEVRV